MLTIRTVQNIKRGSRITFWNGIYAITFGILYILFIKVLLKMDFRRIDAVWQVFAKYNPQIAGGFIKLMIIKGILIILIGVLIIYLSNYILKKKDRTAWIVLFIVGLIFWASILTIEVLIKNVYMIAASFIGWVMFIIGIILPIRYYLQREYTEY